MLNEPMRSAVEQAARLLPTAEASGSIVYFEGAADSVPLANLTVDASATKITVCGKNLLNDINPILLKDIYPDFISKALKYGSGNMSVLLRVKPNTHYMSTIRPVYRPGMGSDDWSIIFFDEYPVVNSTVGTSWSWANNNDYTTGENDIYAVLKIANTAKTLYQETLSASDFCLFNADRTHEAYIKETEYTLTDGLIDSDVLTLYDKNTIFADVGDISLTYRKDIGLALTKLEAMILENGGN